MLNRTFTLVAIVTFDQPNNYYNWKIFYECSSKMFLKMKSSLSQLFSCLSIIITFPLCAYYWMPHTGYPVYLILCTRYKIPNGAAQVLFNINILWLTVGL